MDRSVALAQPFEVEQISPTVYRGVASSAALASDGLRVPPALWDTAPFLANPVVTWGHPTGRSIDELPVARAILSHDDRGLIADLDFAPATDAEGNEMSPLGARLARMWAAGYIGALSIGGSVGGIHRASDGVMEPSKAVMTSLAIVSVGADPHAVAVARAMQFSDDELTRLTSSNPNQAIQPQPGTPRLDRVSQWRRAQRARASR